MQHDAQKPQPPRLPFVVWAFLLVLVLLPLATMLLPDRTFSPAENRVLAQLPAFSLQKLFDERSNWTREFETYFSDQFALRDQWVSLKASAERCLGKKENGGVYFARDALIERPDGYDEAIRRMNIRSIETFAENTRSDVYLALVPNACCIESARLPAYAADGAQQEIIARCNASLSAAVPVPAIAETLLMHATEPVYYRTDHHPTSLGAYYIYTALCAPLGLSPHPLSAYTQETVSTAFYGTARAKSGAWWISPDSIELYALPDTPPGTLTTFEGGEPAAKLTGLYDRARLATADQYTVFLGGNHPRQVVQTGQQNGRKLLLVKDSFAHCITPFLAAHYSEIHLLDLRYYRASVRDYVQENSIDQVLILYSVSNFMTDKNLLFLGAS